MIYYIYKKNFNDVLESSILVIETGLFKFPMNKPSFLSVGCNVGWLEQLFRSQKHFCCYWLLPVGCGASVQLAFPPEGAQARVAQHKEPILALFTLLSMLEV